jgi:hypothetical protein
MKRLGVFAILVCLIGLGLTSCNRIGARRHAGTWDAEVNVAGIPFAATIDLRANRTFTLTMTIWGYSESEEGTYNIRRNEIVLTLEEEIMNGTITGNTMTVVDAIGDVYIFTKQ